MEKCAAFRSESVFLEAAVGFVGNGHFDEAGIEHFPDPLVQFTLETGMDSNRR